MIRASGGIGYATIVAAALIVVLAGIYFAASFLGWVLLALLFAILCYPLYAWLLRRGLSAAVALTLIALVLTGVVVGLAVMVAASVSELLSNLSTYQASLANQVDNLRAALERAGIQVPPNALAEVINVGAIMGWFAYLLGAITGAASTFFTILLTLLFLLADGHRMFARMQAGLGESNPLAVRLTVVGSKVVRFFGVRAYVNLLTAVGVSAAFWLLGIDYAALWGVLMFFMSFVPYIGIFLASAPPVLLALAEYGVERALVVIVGITIVNVSLENLVMPRLVGTSLRMAPSVVFLSFFFWAWLLGPSGALLAAFLSVITIIILDSYESTYWLAELMTGGEVEAEAQEAPTPDVAGASLDTAART
jgi:predicted PurR-regulated permease PerM